MKKIRRSLEIVPLLFCPSLSCFDRGRAIEFRSGQSWLQLSSDFCRAMDVCRLGPASESLWYTVAVVLNGGTTREGNRRLKVDPELVRFSVVAQKCSPEPSVTLVPEVGCQQGCRGALEVPLKSLPQRFRSAVPWLLQADAPFRLTRLGVTSMSVLTPRAAALLERMEQLDCAPA